jgi:hypothetical protein
MGEIDRIHERLIRLERAEAVRACMARYGRSMDEADLLRLAGVWAEHARFIHFDKTERVGRETIVEFFSATFNRPGRTLGMRHYVTAVDIDTTSDPSKATATSIFLLVMPGEKAFLGQGTYHDEFAFLDDGSAVYTKKIVTLDNTTSLV